MPHLEGRNPLTHSDELLRVLEAPELRAVMEHLFRADEDDAEDETDHAVQKTTDEDHAITAPNPGRVCSSARIHERVDERGSTAVRTLDYKWVRATPPGGATGAHLDWVYMGRGTPNLVTVWIPLGDVPLQLGGLAVLAGSNCAGMLWLNNMSSACLMWERRTDRLCGTGCLCGLGTRGGWHCR